MGLSVVQPCFAQPQFLLGLVILLQVGKQSRLDPFGCRPSSRIPCSRGSGTDDGFLSNGPFLASRKCGRDRFVVAHGSNRRYALGWSLAARPLRPL